MDNDKDLGAVSDGDTATVLSRKRPRRNATKKHVFLRPVSPNSSHSSNDSNFELTVDMMVNYFDDEQTLNEEEALEALEPNSQDEITTLQEESEMPLEELLKRYGSASMCIYNQSTSVSPSGSVNKESGISNSDQADDECVAARDKSNEVDEAYGTASHSSLNTEDMSNEDSERPHNITSHLIDLYPDLNLTDGRSNSQPDFLSPNGLDEEEEDDINMCYRKSVMIGPLYQAAIPEELSQYGDVLPYENEDKLIWEPSQVSEQEVEEYLNKVREVRSSSFEENNSSDDTNNGQASDKAASEAPSPDAKDDVDDATSKEVPSEATNGEEDASGLVKDNEQALHLLVQCGYDFKEALRRRRLLPIPHSDSMSLWSEEECQKFEEGIQKFGKDFYKIRQQLVRTRSMRELVQFYYLWKKSERRDRYFANSDTVDHMSIYLDERGDCASSLTIGALNSNGVHAGLQNADADVKKKSLNKRNISIMTGSSMQTNPSKKSSALTQLAAFSSLADHGEHA